MRDNGPVTGREFALPADQTLVSVTDLKGRITYANDAFVDASGFTRDELLGQPHNLVRHPDMPAEAFRDLWATIAAGRPWTGIVKSRRKNGDHHWVRANATSMRNAVEEVQRVAALLHNIAAATDEQQRSVSEVGAAVAQMDGLTQQNAAMVEQLSAAAQQLALQVQHTEQAMRLLRLHPGEPTLADVDAVALRRQAKALAA